MTPRNQAAEILVTDAISLIESDRIRAWASEPNNRAIFVKIAGIGLAKPESNIAPLRFSAYIVASAIGL